MEDFNFGLNLFYARIFYGILNLKIEIIIFNLFISLHMTLRDLLRLGHFNYFIHLIFISIIIELH